MFIIRIWWYSDGELISINAQDITKKSRLKRSNISGLVWYLSGTVYSKKNCMQFAVYRTLLHAVCSLLQVILHDAVQKTRYITYRTTPETYMNYLQITDFWQTFWIWHTKSHLKMYRGVQNWNCDNSETESTIKKNIEFAH